MAWHPFRNLGLKAAALALGTLLWFTVSSEEVERLIHVPIVSRNLPTGLEITSRPDGVDVRVRGSSAEIAGLTPGQISVVADLAGTEAGQTVVLLQPADVRAPLGVDVTQVEPSTVTYELEKSATAEVPVRATIEGRPAGGYVFREAIVEPRTVTVVGPASRLRSTTFAVTERVSIEGQSAPFVQVVGVGVSDALVRLVEARTARVTVRIEPASSDRTMDGRTVTFRNLAAGRQAMVDPSTVTITIQGRASALADLSDSAVQAWVDLAGLAPGLHDRPVSVAVPPGFTVVVIRPAAVAVRIR
ncbi:MAG TPA: CdaR family protein [Vicinamibacterales bacterium]|nr:CdaR family protein [Vicinamibacterales bacterium]